MSADDPVRTAAVPEPPSDLYAAIGAGDAAAVDAVLARGAAIDPGGPLGVGPILHALYHGHADLAARIADRPGHTATLHETVALGRADALAERLTDAAVDLTARSADGFTPTHYAAFFGHERCLRMLLDAGAPADEAADNPTRVRPLHSAFVLPAEGCVRALLDAGVDVDARQAGGLTALHSAYYRGVEPLIELLLAHGADTEVTADDGRKPAEMRG